MANCRTVTEEDLTMHIIQIVTLRRCSTKRTDLPYFIA